VISAISLINGRAHHEIKMKIVIQPFLSRCSSQGEIEGDKAR